MRIQTSTALAGSKVEQADVLSYVIYPTGGRLLPTLPVELPIKQPRSTAAQRRVRLSLSCSVVSTPLRPLSLRFF